ncbi:hypothetical protein [Photobacterium leiognathi]|uniref:hypothetical protein n=1 Tax=Photobacterium leiognathi TaxID=553611 RepID=UPI0029821D4F|nr:hypothetical protein [Photobacterium leiognathi]
MELDAFNYSNRQIKGGIKRGVLRYDSEGDLEKCCTRCADWLPLDTDFWHSYKSNTDNRKVVQPHCRVCEQARKNYTKKKEIIDTTSVLVMMKLEKLLRQVFRI